MIIDGFAGRTIYNIPKYCEYCGHSFPWTENALNAANELIDGFDALSDDEKDALKQDIDDMVKDTSRAPVAATRYQKLVAKVGDEAIFALKTILYGLFTHAIATQLRWI
jgi:hypothetical protein